MCTNETRSSFCLLERGYEYKSHSKRIICKVDFWRLLNLQGNKSLCLAVSANSRSCLSDLPEGHHLLPCLSAFIRPVYFYTHLPPSLPRYLSAYLVAYLPTSLPAYLSAYLPTLLPIYLPADPLSVTKGIKRGEMRAYSLTRVLTVRDYIGTEWGEECCVKKTLTLTAEGLVRGRGSVMACFSSWAQ